MFSIRTMAFLMICIYSFGTNKITQPTQPEEGCGGKSYFHEGVDFQEFGNYKDGYFLFEPIAPKPDSASVVIFMHGHSAYNPMVYGKWIKHLVQKGNIVIFPKYQKNITVPRHKRFVKFAVRAIENAFEELKSEGHVKPNNQPVFMIGHSFGGAIIANVLQDWGQFNIPKPGAVMLVSPGVGPFKGFEYDSYDEIPSDVNMLIMVSNGDLTVGDRFGKLVFNTATNTPNRNLIRQFEDDYGEPKIRHGHVECYARDKEFDSGRHGYSYQRAKRSRIDPVDYNGYWKLFDALQDCTLNEENCNIAFGDTPEQRSLGNWSDGTPIKPLEITLPSNLVSK